MPNPLIVVNSALYGAPGIPAVDVTANIQALFDLQYLYNQQLLAFTLTYISPALFNIDVPVTGQTNTLTIAYSIPAVGAGKVFFRGGLDGQTLSLSVAPLNGGEVIGAFYGTGSLGIDLTAKLISYLADPGNSRQIEIGGDAFDRIFCGGNDPAPGILKCFSVRLRTLRRLPDSKVINQCGYVGQTVDLTLPADPTPLIVVNSALYGAAGFAVVDVTANIQAVFDLQYQNNPQLLSFTLPISPASFNTDDPATGQTNTLTIAYSIPAAGAGNVFFRGGLDGQTLSLLVTPLNSVEVVRAFYGAGSLGIDLTTKLISYLADPGNSRQIEIGGDAFDRVFCGGNDPAPGTLKCFSVTLSKSGYTINQCGYVGQTVDLTPPANQSWMTDLANSTPGFRDLTLSQICLPATHDTGTYNLGSTFTNNPKEWIKVLMDTIQKVTQAFDVIPGISIVIDPLDWVQNAVLNDTRALATATHSDIRQQLNDGIRYLDLRVYYNHNDATSPFYTYHGVTGVKIATILDEVRYFISVVAPAGEIIYITMSEYWDDDTPDNGFTDAQIADLSDLVWGFFYPGQLFGPRDAPIGPRDTPTDLLNCTYCSIVGGNKSRVVLVMQQLDADKIWPLSGVGSPQFWGGYKDTDEFSQMIPDQQSKSMQAKSNSLPFQLALTLTPLDAAVYKILEGDLAKAIGILAAEAFPVPFYGPELSIALGIVAAGLAIAGANPPYSSLQELSSKIFISAAPTVSAVYQNYFVGTQYAVPSIIWMDFYEDHRMDTQAGHNVAQVVELSKVITRANAVRGTVSHGNRVMGTMALKP